MIGKWDGQASHNRVETKHSSTVTGGYSRQGLASAESQVRCRVTLTAGCAVEFGKRILCERKASCPPTILLHSRAVFAHRLRNRSHIQRLLAPALAPNSRLRSRTHPLYRRPHSHSDSHTHPGCILACVDCTISSTPTTALRPPYQQYHRPPTSLCFVLVGHSRLLPRATPIPDKAKSSASFLSITTVNPQAQIAPPVCVASSTTLRPGDTCNVKLHWPQGT
jgi:hypothetical protein